MRARARPGSVDSVGNLGAHLFHHVMGAGYTYALSSPGVRNDKVQHVCSPATSRGITQGSLERTSEKKWGAES